MDISYKMELTEAQIENWKVKEAEIIKAEEKIAENCRIISASIISLLSLYLSLKETEKDSKQALIITQSHIIEKKAERKQLLKKLARNYGGFLLFRKVIKKYYKNDCFGYQSIKEDGKHLSFIVNHCIIKDLCERHNCIELLPCFCDSNWTEFCEIPSVEFTRSKAMGHGDDSCDFNFVKRKKTGK